MRKETICGFATAMAQAGVGIIRVSGEQTKKLATMMLGFTPKARYAHYGAFYNETGQLLDKGVAIFFPAPHSLTGEDVLELHCHGGHYVMQSVMAVVSRYAGIRPANAGEFLTRAFCHGKIDLLQAEATADLIAASSEQAAVGALRSLQGDFSKVINALLTQLTQLRVMVESDIDFSDDVPESTTGTAFINRLGDLAENINLTFVKAEQGQKLQAGVSVVIAGKPNAGKSSLFNALIQSDDAIVTPVAGTTRDTLKSSIDIDGITYTLFDTAGLRKSKHLIEQQGIKRAQLALEQADIVLFVYDARYPLDSHLLPVDKPVLKIKNKIDLLTDKQLSKSVSADTVLISTQKKQGLAVLRQKLKEMAAIQSIDSGVIVARKRHLDALKNTSKHIALAIKQHGDNNLEFLAEELRLAQHYLGQITGVVHSDDLLGEIFSSFCIGK